MSIKRILLALQIMIMSEYIFYTTEGFTQAPDGESIENCQLLGIACGVDENDALDNLLKQNLWIVKRGYNPSEISYKRLSSL